MNLLRTTEVVSTLAGFGTAAAGLLIAAAAQDDEKPIIGRAAGLGIAGVTVGASIETYRQLPKIPLNEFTHAQAYRRNGSMGVAAGAITACLMGAAYLLAGALPN